MIRVHAILHPTGNVGVIDAANCLKLRSPKGRLSGLDLQRCFDESISSLALLKGQELGFRLLKEAVSCATDVMYCLP